MGQDTRSIFQFLKDRGYGFLIGGFHVKGQVIDSRGVSASKVLRLDPVTADLTLTSSPSGIALSIGDTSTATPFTRAVNTTLFGSVRLQSGSAA